jgi:hypothetical protein
MNLCWEIFFFPQDFLKKKSQNIKTIFTQKKILVELFVTVYNIYVPGYVCRAMMGGGS